MNRVRCVIVAILLLSLAGCAGARAEGPYRGLSSKTIDRRLAESLTQEAVEIAGRDPARAESLLRQALEADLFHGPAHNNLGVLHLKRGDLYEAASEFEWARKLMPGHPDPRLNLAMTLERAGRHEEAQEAYAGALQVHRGYMAAMQGLARSQIRTGRTDDRTPDLLREIAFRGETAQWREWARGRLASGQ